MINAFKPIFLIAIGVLAVSLVCPGSGQAFTAGVPAAIIQLPENENAIIVEKKSQMLYVYSSQKGAKNPVFQSACSTGANPGPKLKAGDKKTPEGIYFLKHEFEDRYLTAVYGKKAFTSDYPNFLDLRLGKQGSAIWLHGTDKHLKPKDSNGCVALENKNIIALADYIHLDATPLVIVEQIDYTSMDKLQNIQEQVSGFIAAWARALAGDDYHDYLSFYDAVYLPDISWWEDWCRLRNKGLAKKKNPWIILNNTGMYAHSGVIVVLTDISLAIGSPGDIEQSVYLGKRQLFIRQTSSGPAIIGDLFQKKPKRLYPGQTPLIAGARKLFQGQSADVAVVKTVEQWLAAWSAKNMTRYADFYASNFECDGLGKKAWVKRKKKLAQKYDYISVTGKDYKVVPRRDGYEVSFVQNYRSSGFSTQGRKQLKLVEQDGEWKIFRENWKGR